MKRVLPICLLVACAGIPAARLPSQCASLAAPANVLPGVMGNALGGTVWAMTPWDPDGPGPQQRGIVLAGFLTMAGGTPVDGVAFLDPATHTFRRLGAPVVGPLASVTRLAAAPQGQLFALAGQRVLRWNGAQWQPLSLQIDGPVHALAVLPNGEPVIGGQFSYVDGVACTGLARLAPAGWTSLGFLNGNSVFTLAVQANGDLLVGGDLAHPSGTGGLATVSGGTVSLLPGAPRPVVASAIAPNGDLVVSASQPAAGVFRRSGGVWSSLTTQGSFASAMHVAQNGDLYVGGSFTTFEGVPCKRIARFDGSAWTALGAGVDLGFVPNVSSIVDAPNGGIAVAGNFLRAGNTSAASLARWDGTFWSTFGSGVGQPVRVVLPLPNGDLIVAGDFQDLPDANGARCQRIARRSNGQWFALGGGLDGGALALARLPNGDLVAGGTFQQAGGVPCRHLARWDGSSWHAFGTGADAFVHTLAVLPNGDLLAGGYFGSVDGVAASRVARWDGTQFHPFGAFDGGVEHLAVRANGGVLACGAFTAVDGQPASRVAAFAGGSWSPLGAGIPALVGQILESNTGLVVAATGGGAHRWDGVQWQALGTPSGLSRLCGLADGSVLISYGTGSSAPEAKALRYDGTSVVEWARLSGGRIDSMVLDRDDRVWVAGAFMHVASAAGDVGSPFLVSLSSSCAAAQVRYGTGCVGSGGLVELTGVSRPWLGGTWRARSAGVPAGAAIVLQSVGFPNWPTPLGFYVTEGQPGCDLLAMPVLLDLLPVAAGGAETAWPVPNVAALVGQSLALQHLPCEFGPGGLTAVFASNALLATVGSY